MTRNSDRAAVILQRIIETAPNVGRSQAPETFSAYIVAHVIDAQDGWRLDQVLGWPNGFTGPWGEAIEAVAHQINRELHGVTPALTISLNVTLMLTVNPDEWAAQSGVLLSDVREDVISGALCALLPALAESGIEASARITR